jgi:hypothetical protein
LGVFEDHATLIFELLAYDEIEIIVGHTNRLPISIHAQIYHRAIGSLRGTKFVSPIIFMCCISALFWPSPLGERWPAIYPWTSRFAASGLSGLGAMENLRALALFGR